jgi:hypothetical protein
MNRKKIKLIIHNLELLVNSLKEEIQEPSNYGHEEIIPYIKNEDVDEYYNEEQEDV